MNKKFAIKNKEITIRSSSQKKKKQESRRGERRQKKKRQQPVHPTPQTDDSYPVHGINLQDSDNLKIYS